MLTVTKGALYVRRRSDRQRRKSVREQVQARRVAAKKAGWTVLRIVDEQKQQLPTPLDRGGRGGRRHEN